MSRILTHNVLRSAENHPDRIAFKQLDQAITYTQLRDQSYQLANTLIQAGIKKGDRVGIFMNRSFESAVSVYGILFAGAAYVPIDTNLPPSRVLDVVNDCNIKIIISKQQFKKKIAGICTEQSSLVTVVGLDDDPSDQVKSLGWKTVRDADTQAPDRKIAEEDIAYIIYTSGTTGKPKGIVHTHSSGYSYAKLSAELYDLTYTDILGNHSHLHYDISTMGYLTMPYVGGCTIIIPEAHTKFPVSLGQMIEQEGMTVWYSVPLALIQLLTSQALVDKDMTALRWVLFGGEIFAIKYFKQLFELLPNAVFSNVYGPAEVNQCTYFHFDQDTQLGDAIPLGQAWPETLLDLIDTSSSDDEVVGELVVASSTRMQGYWNKKSLTKEKSVTLLNPNGITDTYYKTGDIVKRTSIGELIFIGRKDRQIKIRGYRVELNAIETILLSHQAIKEAAVYAIKEGDINQIYANIVLDSDSIDEVLLNKYLAQSLPTYAIPQYYRIVQSIPRTGAGKVNYKLLSK